uniref:Uncharacterized protein n=2 Tax=Lygus hesperus TaxID=30085 RepID=A0A146MEW5_LYGHE
MSTILSTNSIDAVFAQPQLRTRLVRWTEELQGRLQQEDLCTQFTDDSAQHNLTQLAELCCPYFVRSGESVPWDAVLDTVFGILLTYRMGDRQQQQSHMTASKTIVATCDCETLLYLAPVLFSHTFPWDTTLLRERLQHGVVCGAVYSSQGIDTH